MKLSAWSFKALLENLGPLTQAVQYAFLKSHASATRSGLDLRTWKL